MIDLVSTVLECGADKAVMIDPKNIVTNKMFDGICKSNACGKYDKCYMCPPALGNIEELMAKVHMYKKAMIYQTIDPLEDSFDIEGMEEASKRMSNVVVSFHNKARKIMDDSQMFHLGPGYCYLCDKCAILDDKPCRFPEDAFPGLEGCGVDVYSTIKNTELKYINGKDTVTYFGLMLFEPLN